jgi:hypothetical protein
MIDQLEIHTYLKDAIPAISVDLSESKKEGPYDMMQTLQSFTFKNIEEHNYNTVTRCFNIAEKLYKKGNQTVQNAVQNVFVFSFTKMFETFSSEKPQLVALLPATLYALYLSQVHHRGC